MKNQKFLFTLGLSTILFSCSNDESVVATSSNETEIAATVLDSKATFKVLDATSIPASISKTIVAQYPGGTLTQVNLLSSGVYEAIVVTNSITSKGNSKLKVSFTSRGTVKSTTTQTSVVVANLPTSITSYIATNYNGAVINSAHIESDGRYDVLVTTTSGVVTKIYFTAAGVYISAYTATTKGVHTVIAVADLLIDITNYISANYVGSTITSAYMDSDGSFDVYITTAGGVNTKLDFTAAGVFVSASSGTTSSVNHTHTSVVISSLPTAISTYISANYVGSTITSAYTDSDGSFDVYITTAGGVNTKLDFTAAGVFVSTSSGTTSGVKNHTHTSVVISSLPTAISTYISANYVGSTITSAYMDSDGSFDVYITTAGGVNTKLDFTAAGVFVSASTGNGRGRSGH